MLLPNIIYQFFIASSPASRRQPDPEKGPAEPEPTADTQAVVSPNGAEGDDYLPIDDHNENDIIRELEQEEYPAEEPPPRRARRFSTFSSFSTLKHAVSPSGFSGWWSKLKAVLDPRTSHADLESYVPNYRYLPIISGIVIPFSILLEIPGLTEDWYIRTVDNKTVEKRKNTAILDVGLAFSVACAVVANICLVVRFMEKKVKYMTILCIIFLTIHDLINIITVIVFGVEHRFDDGFTYGQAFWMTLCSTTVSSFTNVTLIVDLVRTPDFTNSGSGLTRKQRSLVIIVIILLCYIGFGAMIQTFMLDLTFINALYFTVVSIETIGFGDIVPISAGDRVFTCLFSVVGIINLALAVGLTRETVLEGVEVGYRKRVKSVREHRKALQWERRVSERWRAAVEWRLREAGQPTWAEDDPDVRPHAFFSRLFDDVWPWPTGNGRYFRYSRGFGHGEHPHGMHLNLEALRWPQLEAAAMEVGVPLQALLPQWYKGEKCGGDGDAAPERERNAGGKGSGKSAGQWLAQHEPGDLPLTHARLGLMVAMLGRFAFAVDGSSFARVARDAETGLKRRAEFGSDTNVGHRQSVAQQYESLRAGMKKEERRAFYARLLVVWALFIVFWMVGSTIFMVTEGWSYGIAMYFCFIAFTTIGYGDYTPETPAGRSVFVVWALLGVGTMTILISILSEAYSFRYKNALHSSVFDQAVKHYRARTVADSARPEARSIASPPLTHRQSALPPDSVGFSTSASLTLSDSRKRVEGKLEALPHQVLQHARTFNENARYLMESESLAVANDAVPDGLKKLVDDVTGVEKLGERIKQEILLDKDARHTLLVISVENALRKMIAIAEEAIESLAERDHLVKLQNPEARSPQ